MFTYVELPIDERITAASTNVELPDAVIYARRRVTSFSRREFCDA